MIRVEISRPAGQPSFVAVPRWGSIGSEHSYSGLIDPANSYRRIFLHPEPHVSYRDRPAVLQLWQRLCRSALDSCSGLLDRSPGSCSGPDFCPERCSKALDHLRRARNVEAASNAVAIARDIK